MNIEFHYYMTYLIAVRAGFKVKDAHTIAYACEFIDENEQPMIVDKGRPSEYISTQTQACNADYIPESEIDKAKIYSIFHFIPGYPSSNGAARKDKNTSYLNTTPNSLNAQEIFDKALATKNLYRIGIAAHGYADTWAHQNFEGQVSEFNQIFGVDFLKPIKKWDLPDLGHAEAFCHPDYPSAVWTDSRLKESEINNKARFLDAAGHLFWRLAGCVGKYTPDQIEDEKSKLIADLDAAIGIQDDSNDLSDDRTARYRVLSEKPEYGGELLEPFKRQDGGWRVIAIYDMAPVGDEERMAGATPDGKMDHFWKDSTNYTSTDWYKFQAAAREHQSDAIAILSNSIPEFKDLIEGKPLTEDERLSLKI
jgi:hypothetical protein